MRLPSYLSVSYFLCGLAQGRLFRSLPGRSSFATEKVCRCDEGSWYLLSAGCVHPASWTVTPSHKSTVARWCIFRLSSAAHHRLSQVQTVPWTCRQWVAASRGLMVCTTLPNAVGCSSVPSGKRADRWITFCIHTHGHMEWQLLFWPSLAPAELVKGSSLGQQFSSSQSKSFPPADGAQDADSCSSAPLQTPFGSWHQPWPCLWHCRRLIKPDSSVSVRISLISASQSPFISACKCAVQIALSLMSSL